MSLLFFIFYQKKHFKNYEMILTVSRFKVLVETGIVMVLLIGLNKLANAVFGINRKPRFIKSLKFPK